MVFRTEKSYTRWTKTKIEEILVGFSPEVDPNVGSVQITSLKSIDGEVTILKCSSEKNLFMFGSGG